MKYLFSLWIMLCINFHITAQDWISANGLANSTVFTILHHEENTLLAGLDNNGVFISYDNGLNWEAHALAGISIHSLHKHNDLFFAGTDHGIYKTNTINGDWELVLNNNFTTHKIATHNGNLYACGSSTVGPSSVLKSTDDGNTWSGFGSGPPYNFLDIAFHPENDQVFVASSLGAYYTDNDSSWTQTTGISGTINSVIYVNSNTLAYNTYNGIYLSTDNGNSAQEIPNTYPGRLFHIDNNYFLAGTDYLRISNNLEGDWEYMFLNEFVNDLIKSNDKLIAASASGIHISTGSLSTNEDFLIEQIHLFSNSDQSGFELQLPTELQDVLLEVYNTSGQIIYKQELKDSSAHISGSQWSPGVYILQLKNTKGLLKTIKVIR